MGKGQRDTGLAQLTDDEILAGTRDQSRSAAERRRYLREAKYRALRNRPKRKK